MGRWGSKGKRGRRREEGEGNKGVRGRRGEDGGEEKGRKGRRGGRRVREERRLGKLSKHILKTLVLKRAILESLIGLSEC